MSFSRLPLMFSSKLRKSSWSAEAVNIDCRYPAPVTPIDGLAVINVRSPVKVRVVSRVMSHTRRPPASGAVVEGRPDTTKFWVKNPA